jgi:hypothetical protein
VVHVIPGDDNDGFHTSPPTVRDPNRECTPPRPRYGEARLSGGQRENARGGIIIGELEDPTLPTLKRAKKDPFPPMNEPTFHKNNFGGPPPPSAPAVEVH